MFIRIQLVSRVKDLRTDSHVYCEQIQSDDGQETQIKLHMVTAEAKSLIHPPPMRSWSVKYL